MFCRGILLEGGNCLFDSNEGVCSERLREGIMYGGGFLKCR